MVMGKKMTTVIAAMVLAAVAVSASAEPARNQDIQNALKWLRSQRQAVEADGVSRRRQTDVPEPSYPRQIFSEIYYENSDFSTGSFITGEGQLYADGLLGRSRIDLITHSTMGDLPVSTVFHDDESTEWSIYSFGPTGTTDGPAATMFPWPIECTYLEEIPFISAPDVWIYLGPYFYLSHAGDAYYAFNSDTNVTHYWVQDLYTAMPLLNVFDGWTTEEAVGYLPITTKAEAQPLSLFQVPDRLDCQLASTTTDAKTTTVNGRAAAKGINMPTIHRFRM